MYLLFRQLVCAFPNGIRSSQTELSLAKREGNAGAQEANKKKTGGTGEWKCYINHIQLFLKSTKKYDCVYYGTCSQELETVKGFLKVNNKMLICNCRISRWGFLELVAFYEHLNVKQKPLALSVREQCSECPCAATSTDRSCGIFLILLHLIRSNILTFLSRT